MITSDDLTLLLFTAIELVVLAFIIYWLLYFVSDLLLSLVRSVRSSSIIYDSDLVTNPQLVSNLDKKTMIDQNEVY